MRRSRPAGDETLLQKQQRGAMTRVDDLLTTRHAHADSNPEPSRERGRWGHRAAPWLALVWALAYLGLATLHLTDRGTAPWTPTDASVIGGLDERTVSVALVVLAVIALAALVLTVPVLRRPGRAVDQIRRTPVRLGALVLILVGALVALLLADARSLMFLGYLPMV